MTDHRLDQLLGTSDRDAGCDAGMDLIDEYCELIHAGRPVPDRFEAFVTHIGNCVTCREDTESLLAVLRDQANRGTG